MSGTEDLEFVLNAIQDVANGNAPPVAMPQSSNNPAGEKTLEILQHIYENHLKQRRVQQAADLRTRRSLDTARGMLNASREVMFLIDPEGKVLGANDALATSLGVELSDLIGKNIRDFLEPEIAEQRMLVVRRVAETARAEGINDERAGRHFENYFEPIRNEHGIVDRVAVFARNTTAQKRAHELEGYARGLIEAQESERRRVARELHDGVAQLLISAKLALKPAADEASSRAMNHISLTRSIIERTIDEVDAMSKGLRSPLLDSFGLQSALEKLCADLPGLKVDLTMDPVEASAASQEALFRIAQEALNNTVRHANATTVDIKVLRESDGVRMTIGDDGQGVEESSVPSGMGMMNMRERARILGGTCDIRTNPQTGGTVVYVFLPSSEA